MKLLYLLFSLCFVASMHAQVSPLNSQVYTLNSKTAKGKRVSAAVIFSGSGAVLAQHRMVSIHIPRNKRVKMAPEVTEQFFIVREGPVQVTLHNSMRILTRGSVIAVMPGDQAEFVAVAAACELYEMEYVSQAQPDPLRAQQAGGSFMMEWNDVVFKPHDKGGVRQFFDRQTAMLNRFDIHVTTLNPNNKSHDPHTHKNEEIILMLQGNAEMQIGTEHQKANAGDVVYLGSMVLHNLTNIGAVPCIYFAIQWN